MRTALARPTPPTHTGRRYVHGSPLGQVYARRSSHTPRLHITPPRAAPDSPPQDCVAPASPRVPIRTAHKHSRATQHAQWRRLKWARRREGPPVAGKRTTKGMRPSADSAETEVTIAWRFVHKLGRACSDSLTELYAALENGNILSLI